MVIPKIAASHAFLLDGMLALSSMHLAFLDSTQARYWLEVGLKYQTSACSSLSRLLTVEVSPDTYGPAFLCSVFIMLTANAYPSVSRDKTAFNLAGAGNPQIVDRLLAFACEIAKYSFS